ncbi:MAG: DNA-directed RNA polymerase subunit alpha, partial [Candidatus Paceibacterota bacterium]
MKTTVFQYHITMSDLNIILPSKLSIISEVGTKGVYEIDGLYPGYGHTLGNSLRRIILSSLTGAAITSLKINGVDHEFSVIDGVKEDVITILLHLKQVRFRLNTDEPQKVLLHVKGPKQITASDIQVTGQVEILNDDLYIAEVTGKNALSIEMTVEKGLGFVPKEMHQKTKN